MEQVLLSSPGGHSEWELEQKPSPGFLLLDSDEDTTLSKGNEESLEPGLDFQESDKDLVSFSFNEILQENALKLNDIFQSSGYSPLDQILSWDEGSECAVLQWTEHTSQSSGSSNNAPVEVMSFPIATEEHNFDKASPVSVFPGSDECNREDVVVQELAFQQDTQLELRSLNNIADELINVEDSSSFMDFKWEDLTLVEASSSCTFPVTEMGLLGASEKPCLPSEFEHSVPCAVPQGEGVSCESGDKGSPGESRRDPHTLCNSIQEAAPESCCSSPSHLTNPAVCQEAQEDDVLIPGGESVDINAAAQELHACENGVQTVEAAVTGQDVSRDTVDARLPVEQRVEEGPSLLLYPSEKQATSPSADGDALCAGDTLRSQGLDQNVSEGLMADEGVLCLTEQEAVKDHLLDFSLTDLMHDIKIDNGSKTAEEEEREALAGLKLDVDLEHSKGVSCQKQDHPGDLAQGLYDSSTVTLRTREETIERLSLPEVRVPTALPVRGSVSLGEEDMSPLKAVFDALDQDSDGFVRIEEFVQFATVYGAEQVKDLTRFLDPSGLGVISFEDFYRGISAISNGGENSEAPLYDVGLHHDEEARGCSEEFDDSTAFEQNEVTDSAYLGSESTYSECETFTDEDTGTLVHPELHEEVETDSAIDAALHDPEDAGNSLSLASELNSHSLVTVISGEEEHFEDFGEGHDSELLLDVPDGMEAEGSLRGPGHSSTMLLSPSTSKRLSSKKVARHLLQSSTLSAGSMDDLSRDILELADTDITDKVTFLEKRVSELEQDSSANEELHLRLRQENLQLVHRANALEEQLKEQETRSEEALQLEVRRQKDAVSKLEREQGIELENLQSRLHQLDEENGELRSCVPCLRANIERLDEEKRKLQDEVEHTTQRLGVEMESRRKMADKLSYECHKHQKEKECTQELIEDLRKQLEHLQLYKLEVEAKSGRSPSAGLQEYQSRTREAELEQEIRRLKQENRILKEQNDELNGQIINLSIQGAKNLFSTSFSESLAAEISSVSRDELMEAIHKQEEINYRLQDYIDRIIVAIMESNPSILEVK